MHYASGFKGFAEKPESSLKAGQERKQMIITTDSGQTIDTGDLSPEERHVIQKLLAWMTLVDSVDQFGLKKQQALAAGWNDSGPVRETRSLSLVFRHLEKQVLQRLKNQTTG